MTDDIVTELDRWLETEANDPEWAAWHGEYAVMRRARDEIAALRSALSDTRDEILEEAATIIEEAVWTYTLLDGKEVTVDGEPQAAAIRNLKTLHKRR